MNCLSLRNRLTSRNRSRLRRGYLRRNNGWTPRRGYQRRNNGSTSRNRSPLRRGHQQWYADNMKYEIVSSLEINHPWTLPNVYKTTNLEPEKIPLDGNSFMTVGFTKHLDSTLSITLKYHNENDPNVDVWSIFNIIFKQKNDDKNLNNIDDSFVFNGLNRIYNQKLDRRVFEAYNYYNLKINVEMKVRKLMFQIPDFSNAATKAKSMDENSFFSSILISDVLKVFRTERNDIEKFCLELLKFANTFSCKNLKLISETNLAKYLTAENCISLLIEAINFSAEDLKQKAIEFIASKLGQIMATEQWNDFKKNHATCATEIYEKAIEKKNGRRT